MGNQSEKAFLCTRLKELREKNGCTMEEMARRLDELEGSKGTNKSSISRVEGGKTGENTLLEMARKYCEVFKLTKEQTEQILRGQRIVVPDTSALLKNAQLITTLEKEYSKIIVPNIVSQELEYIKGDYDKKYTVAMHKRAWQILGSIGVSGRIDNMQYFGDDPTMNNDAKIIWVARAAAEKYHCKVDIITDDIDYSANLKGDDTVKALSLREYMANRQNIINMERFLRIRDYYALSYEDAETPTIDEVNAYDKDGYTLLIACVREKNIDLEMKKAKIKWLIKNHADINQRDCNLHYFTALMHAVQMNNKELVQFLLDECGANPNAGSRNPRSSSKVRQKNEGNMPLMVAAWYGYEDITRILCAHPYISINQQDANGFTALIKACANKKTRTAAILRANGADSRIVDMDGKTATDHEDEAEEYGPLAKRSFGARNKNGERRR